MRLLRQRGFARPTLISSALLGLTVGLFVAKFSVDWEVSLLIGSISLLLLMARRPVALLTGLFGLGMMVGLLRGGAYARQLNAYQPWFGQNVIVVGVIEEDPSENGRGQIEFMVHSVRLEGRNIPGMVEVTSRSSERLQRGDVVQLSGKLKPSFGASSQGSISFADIRLVSKNTSKLQVIRANFFAAIRRVLPEPHASFGLGFLVGIRARLPEDFSESLKIVGLTHIIAVSGYNLTILVRLVRRLFAPHSAYQSVVLSLLLIGGFLLMTGWSPSIMRATVITGFSLLAWYYGRVIPPLLLILLGSSITAAINPLYIWGDVGWYLSFLAFSGVIVLAPLVTWRLYKTGRPSFVMRLLIETVCAQLFALPYIAYLFGTVSVIAPIANVLIGPPIPLIMLLVFVVGVVGMTLPILATILAPPLRLLLDGQIWLIEWLSRVSWAQSDITTSLVVTVGLYGALGLLTARLWWRYRQAQQQHYSAPIDWNLV